VLGESSDAAAVTELTAKGAAAFVFHALADIAVVRGVGCDIEVNDDDDDDDGNSPGSGAGLGAAMSAKARRPRAAALVAIALPLNGVKPALLHASFSQFAPSSDAAVFSPAALYLPLGSALTCLGFSFGCIRSLQVQTVHHAID
jgi:hypothetical protein